MLVADVLDVTLLVNLIPEGRSAVLLELEAQRFEDRLNIRLDFLDVSCLLNEHSVEVLDNDLR